MIISTPLYHIVIEEPVRTSGLNENECLESVCPVLDLRESACTASDLSSFVRRFIEFFYDREPGSVDGSSRLQDDIEDIYLGMPSGVEGKYGKWGFDPKSRANTGISSRGLTIYLLIQDATDAMGLCVYSYGNLFKLHGSISLDDVKTVGDFESCLALILRSARRLKE